MKRFLSMILCAVMLCTAGAPPARAASDSAAQQAEACAYALKSLGLFHGDADGFSLQNAPTRLEGFVMLIRLLGWETAAQASPSPHPFTDVPAWGDGYVGYGYQKGLTKGVSTGRFGTAEKATAAQYCIWLLRALGYTESAGDFTVSGAADKAVTLGLADAGQAGRWQRGGAFTRGDVASLSYAALRTRSKGSPLTLAETLVQAGVFPEDAARAAGVWPGSTLPAPGGAARVPDGLYEICAASGGALTALQEADGGHGRLYVTARSGAASQRFTLKALQNGASRLLSADGKAVNANPVQAGALPYLYAENGTDSQYFSLYPEGGGAYSIRMLSDAGLALTNVDGSLVLRAYLGDAAQQWMLLPAKEAAPSGAVPDTSLVSAKLERLARKYPDGYQLPDDYYYQGGIECMGFARQVWHELFGTQLAAWSYAGIPITDNLYWVSRIGRSQYNEQNIRTLVAQALPGDILQFDEPKPHTMVFLWRDADGFGVYDANWGYTNQVHLHTFPYSALLTQDSDHITLLRYAQYPVKV
ncbi:hypothetical protein LI291_13570 [Intestinibacillus massiliensis]|nr:hypothetical protein [Intestinibacillus massiliensis]